jgi:hypothetical protein
MGHDAKICIKHYAQVTEQHFERAVRGAASGSPVVQIAAQQTIAG